MDSSYQVVGVMPAGFRFPDDVDVWQRLRWDLTQHSRSAHFMEGVARLADGVSLEQARGAGNALAARLGTEFANSNKGWSFGIVPLLDDQLGYYRPALYVPFGAVGLLFLIGCLNVASLLLTRALSRAREIAVRTALGATPRQIVTQLLAESLILSVFGAAAGLLVALAALPAIIAVTPVEVPRLAEAAISGRVLALALGLVALMTIGFGLVPGLILVRKHVGTDLRSGERGSSRGSRRVYQGLVVAEVALACALLVSSALLVRTVGQMTRVPLGVRADGVVLTSVQLSPKSSALESWQTVGTLHATILDRLREQPGVTSAGSTTFLPMEHGWRGPLIRGDQPPVRSEEAPQAQHHSTSEGYLETMGATLLEGRLFTAQDTATTESVVVLNETAAKRYFPGETAVGREMLSWSSQIGPLGRNLTWQVGADGRRIQPRLRVVGVIADIQNVALGMTVEPAVYFPTRQFPFSAVTIAISAHDTATALGAMRTALRSVSPHTPLGTVETWRDRFNTPHGRTQIADDDADRIRRAGGVPGGARGLRTLFVVGRLAPARARHSPHARSAAVRGGSLRRTPERRARGPRPRRRVAARAVGSRSAGHRPLWGQTERRGIDRRGGGALVRGRAHRQPALLRSARCASIRLKDCAPNRTTHFVVVGTRRWAGWHIAQLGTVFHGRKRERRWKFPTTSAAP